VKSGRQEKKKILLTKRDENEAEGTKIINENGNKSKTIVKSRTLHCWS
jgi:hypothetical protein